MFYEGKVLSFYFNIINYLNQYNFVIEERFNWPNVLWMKVDIISSWMDLLMFRVCLSVCRIYVLCPVCVDIHVVTPLAEMLPFIIFYLYRL